MTVASEIARIQGVKANILDAIAAKGVTVPSGAMLADCPNLISSISGGGEFTADNVVNIVPIDKMVVVDANGYIGFNLTNYFQTRGATFYYNYAILSESDDFSSKGLGQVTFYTPESNVIGGREYRTVVIGGKEWMAENLDFKFSGLAVGQSGTSTSEPRGNYYNNNESTYGVNGNKYGLLYNWVAANYLEVNKSQLIPGWHVPTKNEWDAIVTAVGGTSIAGTKLKSTTGWNSGNGDGTYGFDAFPAGRYYDSFFDVTDRAYFWTITDYGYGLKYYASLSTKADANLAPDDPYSQFSIRLVKDNQ